MSQPIGVKSGELSRGELAGLLRADQRRRWRQGDRVLVESYLQQHPDLGAEAVLDLIYNEVLLREEAGETVSALDLETRFPQYKSQIRRQLDLHRLLGQTAPTVAETTGPTPEPSATGSFPTVKGFEIIRELGMGGMGVVYQARQVALGRTVALKMIRTAQATPEEMMRFRIEAEAVARFQHPNIVQIYEVGEADGRPYFSLEYMDGGSLEDKLVGKPMPARQAAELLAVLARAIHAAHQRGIVHRDLKPANILLTSDGTPKIADFGLAKRLDAVGQTHTGVIMGTPCYMAPEQAGGRASQIGPAADIYALGALLYDLLTGRPPFEAENSVETILQVLHREPLSPRTLQPRIPRDLETICLKCLDKRLEKRYATALELAEDLDRFLRHEPIVARPIGPLQRAWRWCRREPAWAAVIGISFLALVGFLIAGGWFTRKLQAELQQTTAARQDAEQARQRLQLALVQETAEHIDSDLRQIAAIPRTIAAALQERSDWSEKQLTGWLRAALEAEPRIFGMCLAFEPFQFEPGRSDYALYMFRGPKGLETRQLLPPAYQPIYREWEWYRLATPAGQWSEPYVDAGGGDIPMVTFSVPFQRDRKRAGVVTADLSLEYFRQLRAEVAQSAGFEGRAHGFVVTPRGVVLSHPDPRFHFPGPNADLGQRTDAAWTDLRAFLQQGGSGRTAGTDLDSGRPVTYIFSPVESAGWSVVGVLPD